MLLPLLLLLLLLLYVLYNVLIQGREAPPYNYVVSTYSRSSSITSECQARPLLGNQGAKLGLASPTGAKLGILKYASYLFGGCARMRF